ncbi:MAG TPA: hypothetical protein VGB50_00600 [Flavobacterium sp.]|jgi:hypothetical protein
MNETLYLILEIIRVDIFIAFGLCSILYLILSLCSRKAIVKTFDLYACKTVVYSGIIFFLVWIAVVLSAYIEGAPDDRLGMTQRMFGPYWFGYWLQPLLYIILSQILRLKKVRKQIVLRILIALVFIITVEQFVILITSFHRDYLPSSYRMNMSTSELVVGLVFKLLLFVVLTSLLYLYDVKVKSKIFNQN